MKKLFLALCVSIALFGAQGDKYNEIKKDLLKSDPLFMQLHKEEALAEKIDSSAQMNVTIPRRVPDKFVSILILPFVDSSDVYHDESKVIHKHKQGKWIFGEYTNIKEQGDVNIENGGEFTYFDGDGK